MSPESSKYSDNENYIIDEIIARVGKEIVVCTPLAAGKPNHLLNALYQRAKREPDIKLSIMTALTLEKPKGHSLLERRFLEPMVERVFGDYPDLDFELDRTQNKLPENIRVIEFYFPAGKFLTNPKAQQEYTSSNYTHVMRDLMDNGANVILQMVSIAVVGGEKKVSLSCNPDISLDLINQMRMRQQSKGTPCMIVGQNNPKLPFMYGDAVLGESEFDLILDNQDYYYKIFGPPKMSVPPAEHMIGLYLSSLVKDEGELQVGIGALGDAFFNSILLRQKNNTRYKEVLKETGILDKFGSVIDAVGEIGTFEKGLFGASEMVVDGFLHLYKAGILKRMVYDDLPIQRLINEGLIGHEVTAQTLALLLKRKAVHVHLSHEDFTYLVKYGVFCDGLSYADGYIVTPEGEQIAADFANAEAQKRIMETCLGDRLKNGAVIHGAFFLGPQDFYQALHDLPDEERRLINMRSVRRINHLYGHEEIDRLQRKNARFVNTCMMATLSGSIVSDGYEDGRVVSGVGGQYNFVAMAQALPDGRSLMNLRATRHQGSEVKSNIIWNYGHSTIPRHLRDIVVTEYGIAMLRGKTDCEVIEELIKVTDSRFQQRLVEQAKRAGKLRQDYVIPAVFTNNYPQVVEQQLKIYEQEGLFQAFPFGTDFTEEEKVVGKALKSLKQKKRSRRLMLWILLRALLPVTAPEKMTPYLVRMGLDETSGLEEWLMRRLLLIELKAVV